MNAPENLRSISCQPSHAGAVARMPMLDVVRGTAVLAVFVRHLGDRFRPFLIERVGLVLPEPATRWVDLALERSHWGVDLFFVLSGFTLGLGFLRVHARGRAPETTSFFQRRAARILPGFYAALLVHLALRPGLLLAPDFVQAIASHALLLQGYWGPGKIVIIGASWSLTTEAQFYLGAPAFARLVLGPPTETPRSNLWRWIPIALGTCFAVWLLRAVLHDLALQSGPAIGMLEFTQRRLALCRFDQFAMGFVAAALRWHAGAEHAHRAAVACASIALGAALLAAGVPFDALTWAVPGGNAAYAVVSLGMSMIVFGASLFPDGVAWLFEPLRALGVVSYGVFLYHQLALEIVPRWLPQARGLSWSAFAWTSVGALALACAAGSASWYGIESRALAFVRTRERPARPS